MRWHPQNDKNLAQLEKLINNGGGGGLSFDENMNGALIEIETTGDDQKVIHNLGRIPYGFIQLGIILQDDDLPPGRTDLSLWIVKLDKWTKEALYLRASVENLKVRLFVT